MEVFALEKISQRKFNDCRALLSMYGQLKHCHSTKILNYISEKINMDMVHKVASENRDTTKIKVL